MFNARLYENALPDGFAVLEVTTKPKEARQFVPLKRSQLTGQVTGPLAALVLTQVFAYTRQQCAKVLEAAYRFPLPGDAAVTGVVARFGEVEVRAELKEREQAEQDYKEAKRHGKQAALATRESPDVFTLQVTGLQPDQEVRIETSYVQLVRNQGIGYGMRIPLTTAPRYVRSDESGSRHAHGQPLALLRDPGHRFSLDLTVTSAISVTSATHALAVTEQAGNLRVTLQGGEVLPDRDCELVWLPRQGNDNPTLEMLTHCDTVADRVYFLAQITPPLLLDTRPALPREIVLLVDRSGSMAGDKWQATEFAVKQFLGKLAGADRFSLGFFHNTTRWLQNKQLPADANTLQAAFKFIADNQDSGGTELRVALEQALAIPHTPGTFARHLLIITDAQVSDEGRILSLAENVTHATDRRRISLLCLDAAPNSFLALELAERGGGVARFLTSRPDEGAITTTLEAILSEWAQPIAINLALEVERAQVWASGRRVGQGSAEGCCAIDLGDLPADRSVWVSGCAPLGKAATLAARLNDGTQTLACATVNLSAVDARPAVMALYGARQIVELEFLMHAHQAWEEIDQRLRNRGYELDKSAGAGSMKRVYAENEMAERRDALRQLLVREALRFGLASSETSFIAVRQEKGQRIEGSVAVANALPEGWNAGFLRSPAPQAIFYAATPQPRAMASYLGQGLERVDLEDEDLPVFLRRQRSPQKGETSPQQKGQRLFSGVPVFHGKQAILFDAVLPVSANPDPAAQVQWQWIKINSRSASVRLDKLTPDLHVLIIIGHSIRADLPLQDLMLRAYDVTSLKLSHPQGDQVALVLVDEKGVWAAGAPAIEVIVSWSLEEPGG